MIMFNRNKYNSCVRTWNENFLVFGANILFHCKYISVQIRSIRFFTFRGFKCMNMSNRSKYDIGFTGFGDMALSVFTVYQAASQVQWGPYTLSKWNLLWNTGLFVWFCTELYRNPGFYLSLCIDCYWKCFCELSVDFDVCEWISREFAVNLGEFCYDLFHEVKR